MPEYVYALHDFQPEQDDEIGFRAGERIEVIEKDELYGDGWWKVRPAVLRATGTMVALSSLSVHLLKPYHITACRRQRPATRRGPF